MRYATCPHCQAKLQYRSERTHIDCPGCHQRFAVERQATSISPAKPALKPQTAPPTFSPIVSSVPQTEFPGLHGLIVGLAVGVFITVLVLVAAMFLFSSDGVPQIASSSPSSQVASPPKMTAPKVAADSTPIESKTIPIIPATDPAISLPAPGNATSVIIDTTPALVYRWQVGKQSTYDFTLTAKPPQGEQTIKGYCTYRVVKIVVDEEVDDEPHGSGTAFVVSSDGYLVTCAHVVQDAKQVTVKLGEQQWDAAVVAYDPLQDLALLKVEAKNLPALPLACGSEIELAQPVRVVGYPLTNVLGKGIKITSGSVAGLVETDDEQARRFQVDAIINPGNSGGPLIDDQGRVIGVASALLYGFQISEVGFAIPRDEVEKLLARTGVKPAEISDGQILSGPELARRVVPSVALVEVYVAPSAYQNYRVEYDFHITENRFNPDPNLPLRDRSLALREAQIANDLEGWFDVNRVGEIFAYEGEGNLPFDHEQVGKFIIESLNHGGKSSWTSFSGSTLTVDEKPTPLGPHGFPHPIMSPSPFQREEPKKKTYRALEESEYKIESEVDQLYTIKKAYKYGTLGDEKPPYLEQKGSGTLVFDKQLGLPVSLSFEAVTNQRGANDQITTTPYTLDYQLRATATAEAKANDPPKILQDYFFELGRQTSSGTDKRRPTPHRRQEPSAFSGGRAAEPTMPAGRLNQLILLLDPDPKSGDFHAQRLRGRHSGSSSHLLRELADQSIDVEKQEQVNRIFLHYVFEGDTFDKKWAIRGLDRWSTEKQVPKLIELLTTDVEDLDWPERQDIIQILSRYPRPEVYTAIASRLPYSPESHEAKDALVKFGKPAEVAVIPLLTNLSEESRVAAAEILNQIGTQRSVRALKKAISVEPDIFIKQAMERALEAIKRRQTI